MRNMVSIIYPCYNQPELLACSLESLSHQSFKSFEILLIDDCSTISYDSVLLSFSHLKIKRISNFSNLGAVPNMIRCMQFPVNTLYKVVFHEDDIMHPEMLNLMVSSMESNPDCLWAATNMSFYNIRTEICFPNVIEIQPEIYRGDVSVLVSKIFKGCTLSFASVLYRSSYIKYFHFDLNAFSVLGDRPMLIEIGHKYGCIHINLNLVCAYDHRDSDNRWTSLRVEHIENCYRFLADFLKPDQLKQKDIRIGITRSVKENVRLLTHRESLKVSSLYYKLWKINLFYIKYYLLSHRYIYLLTRLIKKDN